MITTTQLEERFRLLSKKLQKVSPLVSPIRTRSMVIPKNWKPNDHESIKKWMEKLPIVYDLNMVIKNDERYELKKR